MAKGLLTDEEELRRFNAIEAQAQPWYARALPMEGRATFLPFRDTMPGSVFNQRELAVPGLIAEAANAITAPARSLLGTDPEFQAGKEGVNMALNVMGGGVGSTRAMTNPTGQGGIDLALNAWHGTPHNIQGKFDINKVGTGEGAQAYGHGIYFAEARGTGERYKETLKHKGFNFKSEEERLGFELPASARGQFMQLAQKYPDDPMKAAGYIQSGNIAARDIPKEKIADLFTAYKEKTQGNLYKVDIPDEQIPKMLDWDKPLNQQSQAVKDGLAKLGITADEKAYKSYLDDLEAQLMGGEGKGVKDVPMPLGQDIYRKLTAKFGSDAAASRELNKVGIPGIRYLDEGSRAQGGGTSNFVSFQPETVKMLEKNGINIEDLLEQGLLGN